MPIYNSINNKIKFSNTTIIFFRYTNACKEKEDNEAMIVPFLDYKIDATSHNVNSALDELIVILNSIKN